MTLAQMQDFTFKHSEQQDAIYTEYTAQQVKALFDSRGDELRTALNLLVTALTSTDGANNVGTNTIQDVDGATIQTMLQSVRDKLKSKADGTSGADYVNATAIAGLSGETVQALLESLKTYADSLDAAKINANPIAVGSGSTVQAQLAWLLSQVAVAATGSIPDGSLTEAKLAQALVDKINTALSNTGVLTTLLTTNKSSLVNALNEHWSDGAAHGIGNKSTLLTTDKTSIVSAVNELFTNVSDGKTEVATAITDKGVNASGSDTFSSLSSKIGQISTGKKWASGVSTSSSSTSSYYISLSGNIGFPNLTVTGLPFKPSFILIKRDAVDADGTVYDNRFSVNYRIELFYNKNVSGGGNGASIREVSPVSITETGFTLPVYLGGSVYNWIAFE